MKTLILVRHGEPVHGDPSMADINRPLKRRGSRDAQIVARQLARTGIVPEMILSGTAVRTVNTAEAFAQILQVPADAIRTDRRIYEAERAEMLTLIRALDDRFDTVMIVGHNPGIIGLLHHLTDSDVHNMPHCAVAVIELPGASWRDTVFKAGSLDVTLCPRGGEKHMFSDAPETGFWDDIRNWVQNHSTRIEVFFAVFIGFALLLGIVILFLGGASGSGGRVRGSDSPLMPKTSSQ